MELQRILHLGSRVLLGAQKEPGVVDALTLSAVGVVTEDGGYRVVSWEEVSLAL